MTKEDVIRMAREAGLAVEAANIGEGIMVGWIPPRGLERFAALVAAAEREECAKVADNASKEAEKIGRQHPEDRESRDRMFARAREAGYIAAEIRASGVK